MLANYNVKLSKFDPEKEERICQVENKFLMKYSARLSHLSRKERDEKAKELIVDELGHIDGLSDKEIKAVLPYVSGYNAIDPLVTEDAIEEILINGADVPVMIYHRTLGKCKTNICFKNIEELNRLIEKILMFCGLSSKKPIIDAVLPEGPRINCTLPPVSFDSSVVTIRKYLENPPTIIDLIKNGTMNADMAALIWVCVEGFGLAPRNILVTGGTSCGKTTMLNSVIPFVREHERIVSIEDTMELDLGYCDDWVRTTVSEYADMERLVENSLRLRPDRVVVGEVRGKEAFNLVNAMNLGHTGMGTIHADSSRDSILKLTSPPMNVDPRMLVVLDLIIVLTRFHEGKTSRRMVTHVDEVGGIMEGQVQLGSVYRYNAKSRKTEFARFPAVTINKMAEIAGLAPKDIIDEIRKREMILKYLVAKEISELSDFINFVRNYYEEPQKVLNMIMLEKRVNKRVSGTNEKQRGE